LFLRKADPPIAHFLHLSNRFPTIVSPS
jgi:hypothetical protein